MSEWQKEQLQEINEEALKDVAGGQQTMEDIFAQSFVTRTCPECNKPVSVQKPCDSIGLYLYLICPHCGKSISFKF